ncbi:formate dehydrogenase subunit gamma [Chrysiogenes arsenatis]|uniref:formate dehydrogenase subunit gamma n=1 Tax=Chrysiogenes arsenatis TaxID=309797 RepID=UPI000404578E|nr:cytochrome b/b6 domain-containing protein [Chrysiogenes arsenatis]
MQQDTVIRHSRTVRIIHWMVALSGIVLIFSGFGEMPMYKRYMVDQLPGLSWASNYEINLQIHYIAAIFFLLGSVFHAVYHWRRREFAALPQKGDVKESIHIIQAMATGKEEPPHGKFLAEQRLAYAAIAIVSFVLIITGLIKTYKNIGNVIVPPDFLMYVTYTHTFATIAFLLLFLAHLGAFLVKANWPLFPSMFTGRVSRAYAKRRHEKWKT